MNPPEEEVGGGEEAAATPPGGGGGGGVGHGPGWFRWRDWKVDAPFLTGFSAYMKVLHSICAKLQNCQTVKIRGVKWKTLNF